MNFPCFESRTWKRPCSRKVLRKTRPRLRAKALGRWALNKKIQRSRVEDQSRRLISNHPWFKWFSGQQSTQSEQYIMDHIFHACAFDLLTLLIGRFSFLLPSCKSPVLCKTLVGRIPPGPLHLCFQAATDSRPFGAQSVVEPRPYQEIGDRTREVTGVVVLSVDQWGTH